MEDPGRGMTEDDNNRRVPGRIVVVGLLVALAATAIVLRMTGLSIWAVVPIAVLASAAAGAVLRPFAGGMVAGAMAVTGAVGAALLLGVSHGRAWHQAAFAGLVVMALVAPGAAILAGWQRRQITRLSEELDTTDALLRATQSRPQPTPEAAAWAAFYDPLTGLAAHRLVLDRFSQAVAHAERAGTLLGVLLLEIDLPPALRADAAQDAAQEVVRQTGQRLLATIRRGDTAGRLEGMTFVVLLNALGEAAGMDIAESKLREALTPPFSLPGQPQPIAIVAHDGSALFPRDGVTWDELLTFAARNLQATREIARLKAAEMRNA